MTFHDIRFPADISLGASGGPERKTDIVALASGHEQRNALWANSRRRYNAGYGVRMPNDLHAIIEFFEARNGRLHGFRWKDWADYKSTRPQSAISAADQVIGTGDGTKAGFQLVKAYASGGITWTRVIDKPVASTVLVAVNGIGRTLGQDFTVSAQTGLVTFLAGRIPPAGATVTAGFEFDVPVRFDTDHLAIALDHAGAGAITDIPIVEIRP